MSSHFVKCLLKEKEKKKRIRELYSVDVWGIDSDQDQECILQLTRFNKMPLLTMVVNNKVNSEPDFPSIFQVWP